MSVLKGEGKVPILFGSTTLVVGSRTHRGYLARPDLTGEWPTVVLVGSAWGVTPNTKDIARRIARQGFAVVAPDLYHGGAPERAAPAEAAAAAFARIPPDVAGRDIGDIVRFVQNPSGFWSSAEYGFGILGMGTGGGAAAQAAVARDAAALAFVTPALSGLAETLGGYTGGVLGLFGRDADGFDTDVAGRLRGELPQAELVIYSGVGSDFMDDYLPEYDYDVETDGVERLADFFEKHLPAPPA